MEKINVRKNTVKVLADIITPVSIYLKIRDVFPGSLLLESSDYHSNQNSYSFICMDPIADFEVRGDELRLTLPGEVTERIALQNRKEAVDQLHAFLHRFSESQAGEPGLIDGVFGYSSYDAVQYFEDIRFSSPKKDTEPIPEIKYGYFRYIIAINHLKNELQII